MIPKGTVCRVKSDEHNVNAGTRVVVEQEGSTYPQCLDLNGSYAGYFDEPNLEPLSGLDAIKTGDVLVNNYGDERTVLGCCGEVVLLSLPGNAAASNANWTRAGLSEYGFHPKPQPRKRPGYAYDENGVEIGRIEDGKIIR